MLDKKVLIAVPTYNRPEIIAYLLQQLSHSIISTPNLYLGIYDSSDGNETEEIVAQYICEKIRYKRYEKGLGEEKIYDVFVNESDEFEFLWFCSDRKVFRLEVLIPLIADSINESVDLILLSNYRINTEKREITDCYEIGELFIEIGNQAKTIIGRKMFPFMADQENFKRYFGSGLTRQALIVDYCGRYPFRAVQYNLKDQEIAETGAIPFVHEWNKVAIWQWSKCWCDTVDKFPAVYDKNREQIIRSNKMFSFKKIVARRATGTCFPIADIRQYKKYIQRIGVNMFEMYLAMAIPVAFLKAPYKLYKKIKCKL